MIQSIKPLFCLYKRSIKFTQPLCICFFVSRNLSSPENSRNLYTELGYLFDSRIPTLKVSINKAEYLWVISSDFPANRSVRKTEDDLQSATQTGSRLQTWEMSLTWQIQSHLCPGSAHRHKMCLFSHRPSVTLDQNRSLNLTICLSCYKTRSEGEVRRGILYCITDILSDINLQRRSCIEPRPISSVKLVWCLMTILSEILIMNLQISD